MTTKSLALTSSKLPQRLYLFKSCIAGTFYPGIERSFRFILNSLNVDYFDDPNQSSCTGFAEHCGVVPPEANLSLNARNLALAYNSGYTNVVCTCPTSYANLKECICELNDEKTRAAINDVLKAVNYEYNGGVTVYHAAEVLYAMKEILAGRARLSLSGITIATHHGCHYTKAFYDEVVSGPWEYPTLLDEICAAFSGTLLDYSERSLCCGLGYSHLIGADEYPELISFRKLESALSEKPDVIVTMCAGCQFMLDRFQRQFEERLKTVAPVLNVSQLVALLLGANKTRDACLQFATIDVSPLLEKMEAV
jgi:heterodisulfide reductase subunit B